MGRVTGIALGELLVWTFQMQLLRKHLRLTQGHETNLRKVPPWFALRRSGRTVRQEKTVAEILFSARRVNS